MTAGGLAMFFSTPTFSMARLPAITFFEKGQNDVWQSTSTQTKNIFSNHVAK